MTPCMCLFLWFITLGQHICFCYRFAINCMESEIHHVPKCQFDGGRISSETKCEHALHVGHGGTHPSGSPKLPSGITMESGQRILSGGCICPDIFPCLWYNCTTPHRGFSRHFSHFSGRNQGSLPGRSCPGATTDLSRVYVAAAPLVFFGKDARRHRPTFLLGQRISYLHPAGIRQGQRQANYHQLMSSCFCTKAKEEV